MVLYSHLLKNFPVCCDLHKQNLVHTRTQEKRTVTPKENDPDLSVSVPESPAEAWVSSGLLQGQGLWLRQCMHGTFWRRFPLSSLPPPQCGLRSNNREGTHPWPSTEHWIKDLLSKASPIRTRWSFPHGQSLPSWSFHKPLILILQRMKTTITENKSNWSHRPQPCLTQWNYESCHVGPLKTNGSWWRVLTKRGPLEKGMANHFNTLALRTPWAVWKGKNILHWNMNSPGQ